MADQCWLKTHLEVLRDLQLIVQMRSSDKPHLLTWFSFLGDRFLGTSNRGNLARIRKRPGGDNRVYERFYPIRTMSLERPIGDMNGVMDGTKRVTSTQRAVTTIRAAKD